MGYDVVFWYALVPLLTQIGSIRDVFRVPLEDWGFILALTHDPPLPPSIFCPMRVIFTWEGVVRDGV